MCWWQSILVKCGFYVKFDDNIYWSVGAGVVRVVGAGVGLCIFDDVYSDVSNEYGEGFEL